MEKRRWVAVGIAGALFVLSAASSTISNQITSTSVDELDNLIYGSQQLTEQVIEPGDESEKIVRLTVEGTIQDTGSSSLFGSNSYNHQEFLEQVAAAAEDSSVKGILLEVNSPGGAVYEIAESAKALKQVQEEGIPIYVTMKSMAASGGYYISASADKIFATSETTTGSIGVIMSSLNYAGLYEKLGIKDATIKSGPLKDIGSSSRPATTEDQAVLQAYVDSAYSRFVKFVSEGRGMSDEAVRKLADGRIYDGEQAKEVGLVDEIGYPDEALTALRQDFDLEDAQLVAYSTESSGILNSWLGSKFSMFTGQPSEEQLILQFLEQSGSAEAPRMMYMYGGE